MGSRSKSSLLLGTALCIALLTAEVATAGSPTLSYGGRFADPTGKPVEGPVDLSFKFFNADQNGTELDAGAIAVPAVALIDGVFQASIPLSLAQYNAIFSDVSSPVYIEVTDVTHNKTYPRQIFSVVPYALKVPVDGTTITYDGTGHLTLGTQLPVIDGSKLTNVQASSVGSTTASAVTSAVTTVSNAASTDTPSTLVSRDASGNFKGATITADTGIALKGSTSGNYVTLQVPANASTTTYTLPGSVGAGQAGYFLRTDGSGNLTWQNIAGGGDMLTSTWDANADGFIDNSHGGTGISSTATFPASGVIVTEAATETLTNKALTSPVIGTIVNTGTLTLPTSTDTLVGRATTDTLTNKTISGASNTITNVSLTSGVTGVMPVANGGTNSNTALVNKQIMISSGDAVVEGGAMTNGQLLIGSTGAVPAVGSIAGPGSVVVTPGAGSISLDTAQDIRTTASPSFTGLTVSGTTSKMLATNGSGVVGAAGASDVTTALGYTPINKAGDSGVGTLTLANNSSVVLGSGGVVQTYSILVAGSGNGAVQIDGQYYNNTGSSVVIGNNYNNFSGTTGTFGELRVGASGIFQPASGTASMVFTDINPVVNTSGTYAGTTTGLRISQYNEATTGVTTNLLLDVGTNTAAVGAGTHTSAFAVTAAGNVGIASTAPTEKLDLGGGNIAMGWEHIPNNCGSATSCVASCTGTKRATGGSCETTGSFVSVSSALATSSYTCTTNSAPATALIAHVVCANIR